MTEAKERIRQIGQMESPQAQFKALRALHFIEVSGPPEIEDPVLMRCLAPPDQQTDECQGLVVVELLLQWQNN